jgi:integrase/recombinase XerD
MVTQLVTDIRWDRYPLVADYERARSWLVAEVNLQRSVNTIDAYGRGLEDFLSFSARTGFHPESATREHAALWLGDLSKRVSQRRGRHRKSSSKRGANERLLSNATIQQKLTAVRLFYDYLIEESVCARNPVGRGRHIRGRVIAGKEDRGILRRLKKLPWIPNEDQWQTILKGVKKELLRNRFMFALQYDCGLRREELCLLDVEDFDPSYRSIRVRAENTKSGRERVVIYSDVTGSLFKGYLLHRRSMSRARGRLFLSESRRNYGQPISKWTWSKFIRGVAECSGVSRFSTHTLRHLRLTDAARAGWDINEIADFAGHSSLDTTALYIHLSGRDLKEKLARSMTSIHAWRLSIIEETII